MVCMMLEKHRVATLGVKWPEEHLDSSKETNSSTRKEEKTPQKISKYLIGGEMAGIFRHGPETLATVFRKVRSLGWGERPPIALAK